MKDSKVIQYALVNSLSTFVYIMWVVLVMNNGERIFGKMQNVWGPIAFLLLFVTSATITGALVLGRPIYLFVTGAKAESLKLFLYTVGCLLAITVVILVISFLMA